MGLPDKHALVNGKAKYARIFIQDKYPLPSSDTPPIEVWHSCIRHAMMAIRAEAEIGYVYRVLSRAMEAFEGIEYSYDSGQSYVLIDPSPLNDFDKENAEVIAQHEQLMSPKPTKKPRKRSSEEHQAEGKSSETPKES